MPPAERARFRLLGPIEVESGAGPVALGGHRQRLLLAVMLLAAGRAVSTDRLCEMLWGDDQPSHPSAALRSQVARLRRTLSALEAEVRVDAGGYRLVVAPGDVDVHRFEQLVDASGRSTGETAVGLLDDALRLWRGPMMTDLSDCPSTQAVVVRLEEMHVAARERRAEVLLALGQPGDTVAELRSLVIEHPERERARALLMEALTRSGRDAEALDEYRVWRTELAESGLVPSPDLRQLEGKILRHALDPASRPPTRRQRHRIPRPTSSFVGRSGELAELTGSLAAARLVTVTGTGGVGKTRIALAAAARHRDGDSVAFADLSVVNDPGLVAACVADAVGLSGAGRDDARSALVAALTDRPLLLIVDNCEHVLDTVSELVDDLLAHCPDLNVLATSREPLGVGGESVLRLDPLTAQDAAALFVERATDGGARLSVDRDWPIVEEICARLDRLPLAIELAAKHADHLPLSHLRDLLDDRFGLLVGRSRREVSRQRTLEATLRWSYELLDDDQQRLLRRVAVFTGPFTMNMADRVDATSDELATARGLGALHRKSLISFDHHSCRYRLLETVREFALARMADHDEFDDAHRRLYDWLLDQAPGPWRYSFSPESVEQPDAELDNLRGALQWCAAAGRPGAAAALAAAYGPMWFTTIRGTEALGWLVVSAEVDAQLELDARLAWRTAAAYAAIAVVDLPQIQALDDYLRLTPRDHPAWCPMLFARVWMLIQTDRPRLRHDLAAVREAAGAERSWLANCDLIEGLTWLLDGRIPTAIEVLRRAVSYEGSGSSIAQLNLAVAYHLVDRHHDVSAIVADLDLATRPPLSWFFGDVVGALVLVLDAVGRNDVAGAQHALGDILAITAQRYAHARLADGFAVVAAGIVAHTAGRHEEALTIFAASRRHHLHVRYEGAGALTDAYEVRCRHAVTGPVADQATRRGRALGVDALLDATYRVAGQARPHGRHDTEPRSTVRTALSEAGTIET